jgi:hypothetical protein
MHQQTYHSHLTCTHHRTTRIRRWPSHMHRRPVGAPHRESSAVAILIPRTRRELRNGIARNGMPTIERGGILGRCTAKVHGRRRPWRRHVSRRHRVVGWCLHSLQGKRAAAPLGQCKRPAGNTHDRLHRQASGNNDKELRVPCAPRAWAGRSCACCRWCGTRS